MNPRGRGKGERGYAGNPQGTKNPWKHIKPHPTDPNKVIQVNPQTGKKVVKPKPPGYPGKQGGFAKLGLLGRLNVPGLILYSPNLGCGTLDCAGIPEPKPKPDC